MSVDSFGAALGLKRNRSQAFFRTLTAWCLVCFSALSLHPECKAGITMKVVGMVLEKNSVEALLGVAQNWARGTLVLNLFLSQKKYPPY